MIDYSKNRVTDAIRGHLLDLVGKRCLEIWQMLIAFLQFRSGVGSLLAATGKNSLHKIFVGCHISIVHIVSSLTVNR